MAVAYHMVHYRHFEKNGMDNLSPSAEVLLRSALEMHDVSGLPLSKRAANRFYTLSDGSGRQMLLNKPSDMASAVFGEMCLIDENGLQTLLHNRASTVQVSNLTVAEIYRLNEQSAPSNTQFVRGLAYWIVIGDHLFFIKTQAFTPSLLHEYLAWLLGVPSSDFRLQAEFDRAQTGGDIGDIRSLRIGGDSSPNMMVSVPGEGEPRSVATSRRLLEKTFVYEKARAVLETVLGKPETAALVESLGSNEYLSVDTSVRVRGRRTQGTRDRLKEIANSLADTSDGKVRVEGRDGSLSNDDAILRTRMPFQLAHDEGNLLDFNNVADQLVEVYSRFVNDGKIEA